MRRIATRAVLVMGIMVLAISFAATSYAKLVVLSSTFDTGTDGWMASVSNGVGRCGATATTSWGSDGTLAVNYSGASGCDGASIILTKLVVLNAPITLPSTDMAIKDSNDLLNLSSTTAILGAAGSTGLTFGSSSMGPGWGTGSGSWAQGVSNGSQPFKLVVLLRSGQGGSTGVFYIDNVNLYTGN